MFAVIGLVLVTWIMIAFLLSVALRAENHPVRLRRPPGDGGSDDGGGGGWPRRGPDPPPGPPQEPGEPPWWPQFERDLNAYRELLASEHSPQTGGRPLAPPAVPERVER